MIYIVVLYIVFFIKRNKAIKKRLLKLKKKQFIMICP
jgi:hypothetical protein